MAQWSLKLLVDGDNEDFIEGEHANARSIMKPIIGLLNDKRCPTCSGFGHGKNVCPTDNKLSWLRGGASMAPQWLKEAKEKAAHEYVPATNECTQLLSKLGNVLGKR